jgi:cbb3-type cytochrome oxidase cytochrome c subunit
VSQRSIAFIVVLLAGLGWGGLTLAAIKGTPPPTEAQKIDFAGPIQWMQLTPSEMAGVAYYRQETCDSCHNVTGETPKTGPNLVNTARRHNADWMLAHFKAPASVTPGSVMPPVNLTDNQLKDLLALMVKLTPENAEVVDAPEFAREGALIFQKNGCGGCHSVNGAGGKIGPPLNGLSNRRSESWVIQHFQDPKKMVPTTSMPPYKFSTMDMQNVVSYLFTLPNK